MQPHRNLSISRSAFGTALLLTNLSCEPDLVIGSWECASSTEAESASDFPVEDVPLVVPWSTGFENGFCDYAGVAGFCFANTRASYDLVQAPVHSGNWAASFSVTGTYEEDGEGLQARCARQGRLPEEAYYGAWFHVPEEVIGARNWNLFHFEGAEPGAAEEEHGLWDVSLEPDGDGELGVVVYDFLRSRGQPLDTPKAVPVGRWFHLEVYLVRASDDAGTFELYVDGERVLALDGVATDDTELGQWYVGNLAALTNPRPNVLFVDDVTISMVRVGGN